MNTKYILYSGIILLLVGIVFRYITAYPVAGLTLIITGVVLKFAYIVIAMVSGLYKPGSEALLLIAGLGILFLGVWYRINASESIGYAMIAFAVLLKGSFIVLFIRKTRKNKALVDV